MNKTDLVDRAAEPAKVLGSNDGNNFLFGTSGTDKLTGTPKNDILNDGVGVDPLTDGLGGDIFTVGSEADNLVFTKGNESLLDNFDRSTDLGIGTNLIDKFNSVTAANITKVEVISAIPSRESGWNATFFEPTVEGGANLAGFWG